MYEYIATNDLERMEFIQEYVVDFFEEKLNRLIFNESSARRDWSFGWTPEHNDVRQLSTISKSANGPVPLWIPKGWMTKKVMFQSDKNG